jgi:hypothetical protein
VAASRQRSAEQLGKSRIHLTSAVHRFSKLRCANHPGWLLFDAPTQQGLSQNDFDAYTDELTLIAEKYQHRVQVFYLT